MVGGGIFCVQAATAPSVAPKALTEILHTLEQTAKTGITQREFLCARENLKATVLMGMESASNRSEHNGRHELLFGRVQSAQEFLRQMDSLTPDALNALLPRVLDLSQLSLSAVGALSRTFKKSAASLISSQ